jgi:peptidylprolyl isomerase
MLHPADDPNGGGSEFMALKFDPAYTPAGLNTLDGAYSVLGYIVEGAEALDDLDKGDQIVDVKVLSGLSNLVRK